MYQPSKKKRRRTVAAYPQHVYLGDTHVVEVKKGGLHIGIYLITPTSRRRGVVLPLDVWLLLQQSLDTVNKGINTALGIIEDGPIEEPTVDHGEQFTYQTGGSGGCYTNLANNANQYFTYVGSNDYFNQQTTNGVYTGLPSETINATEATVYHQHSDANNIQSTWVPTPPTANELTTFYLTATNNYGDGGGGVNTSTDTNTYGSGAVWTIPNTAGYNQQPTTSTATTNTADNITCSNTQASIDDFFDILKNLVTEETQPCQATV
jgi:hypothetical protein